MEKDNRIALETPEAVPEYEKPTIKVMDRDEVLTAFQMTAAEISSAGCWWGSCA